MMMATTMLMTMKMMVVSGDDDDDDDEYHHCSALIRNRVLESSVASEHRSAEPSHAFTFDLRGDD